MASEVRINFVIGGVDQVNRMLTSVSRATESAAKASARAQRSAAIEGLRATETAARQRVAAETAAQRQIDRLNLASHRHALALSRDRAREETRIAAEVSRRESAMVAERRRAMRGAVGGVVSAAGGAVRTIGRGASSFVSLGRDLMGGAGVEASLGRGLRGRMELEKRAVDLSNSAYQEQGKGVQTVRVDKGTLMAEASKVAKDTATDPTKAMEGLQGFVGITGDLETGRALMGDLAKLSRATGADLAEMVKTAGEFSKSMGDAATNSDEAKARAGAVYTLMKGIAGQTKLGSVEMKDMAQHGARIAAAATQFEGNAGDNMMKMGMLAQEARGGGGAWNAATAAASVSGIVTNFKTDARRKAFRAAGVEIEGEGGKIRDPSKILMDAIDKTGGNVDKLTPLFKNVVGGRAMQGFANKYLEASGGRTDEASRAKGRAAVEAEMNRMTKGATMSDSEVNESFARSMDTAEAKAQLFQQRIDQIAGDLATTIIPVFMRLAPIIETQLVPVLVKFVEDVAKNGPALASALAKLAPHASMAADALAKLIGFAVDNPVAAGAMLILANAGPALMSAAASLSASGAGMTGAATALGSVVAVFGAAVAGFAVGKSVGDDMNKGNNAHITETTGNVADATNLASKIRMGNATPEDIAAAREKLGALDKRANTGVLGRFLEGAGAGVRGLAGGDVTMANVASIIPMVAGIRGATEATLGGSDQKAAAGGAEELREALKSVELKPGSGVNVANAADVGAAIAAPVGDAIRTGLAGANLQSPKAQLE